MELPLTIENGAGESLTFEKVEGDRLIVRNEVQPGSGPPMHVHFHQDESLTVESGRIGYQLQGEEPKFAGPGETVTFTRGTPHKFWAEGDETLTCTGWIEPPDSIVYFLSEIYRSTKENGGHKPNDLDAAYLLKRYGGEFGMPEIPGPVQAVIFPIMRMVGSLTGRYKKYENAPPPAH